MTYVSPVLRHCAPGDVISHLYDVTTHLIMTLRNAVVHIKFALRHSAPGDVISHLYDVITHLIMTQQNAVMHIKFVWRHSAPGTSYLTCMTSQLTRSWRSEMPSCILSLCDVTAHLATSYLTCMTS